jgi:uncharacterized protein YndB with AHSA1/START domain
MTGHDVTMEWRFSAPRETVFNAWMAADAVADWFAAPPFVVTGTDWVPVEGRNWRINFRAPDGRSYHETGSFLTVRRPDRLVFTLEQVGLPYPGSQTTVEVTFGAAGPMLTVMSFRQTGFARPELRDGNAEGWQSCFEQLAVLLRQTQSAASRKT